MAICAIRIPKVLPNTKYLSEVIPLELGHARPPLPAQTTGEIFTSVIVGTFEARADVISRRLISRLR